MNRRSSILLNFFLEKVPEERRQRLFSFLPPNLHKELELLPSAKQENGFGPLLEHVHWSWFIPTLNTYCEAEQQILISVLPPFSADHLRQELHLLPPKHAPLPVFAQTFFQNTLISSLIGPKNRLIPMSYLPASPLKTLLKLSKRELIHLIDQLAFFDLANEMRQIVETKILKKIYSLLTEEERKLLKVAQARQEPFPSPRIGLSSWDGNEETFRRSLHKRGLARLGMALSKQEPDLVWYLCHQLDIGRGNSLFKLAAKEGPPGRLEWVIRQIEELLTL